MAQQQLSSQQQQVAPKAHQAAHDQVLADRLVTTPARKVLVEVALVREAMALMEVDRKVTVPMQTALDATALKVSAAHKAVSAGRLRSRSKRRKRVIARKTNLTEQNNRKWPRGLTAIANDPTIELAFWEAVVPPPGLEPGTS